MASVNGTLGGQPIVLDNAATEATMKQILAALQKSGGTGAASAGTKLLHDAGVDTAKTNKALDSLGKAAGAGGAGAAAALGKMAGGIGLVTGVLGGLVDSAGAMAGAALNMSKQFIDGKATMSGFFSSFKDLPIVGVVAGLFAQLAEIQEENLSAYRKLTDNGVSFGGSLQTVRRSALEMGMSLDEFNRSIKNNADILAKMGGNAEAGAKAFVGINKALKDSKLGDQLLAMGMDFTQMADAVGDFVRNTGGLSQEQLKDYNAVAQAAGEYAKQTDMLSKLTGQSREMQEKLLAEQAKNAAWQAKLATMSPLEAKKAAEALQNAMAVGGKGAADHLQSMVLGFPDMTPEARQFHAIMGEASEAVDGMADHIYDGTDGAEAKANSDRQLAKVQMGLAHGIAEMGEDTANAQVFAGNTTITAALNSATSLKKAGITTEEGALKNIQNLRKIQDDQAKSEAASAADAEKSLKKIGESLMAFIQPLLEKLQPVMTSMIKGFSDWLGSPAGQKGLQDFGTKIGEIVKAMAEYMKNLFSPEGREKIMADIKYGFQLLMIAIRKALDPFYSDAKAAKDEAALKANKEIDDAKFQNAKNEKERADKIAAIKLAGDGKALEHLNKENQARQEQIKTLADKKDKTKEEADKLRELKDQQDIALAKYNEATALAADPKALAEANKSVNALGVHNDRADAQRQEGDNRSVLKGAATGAVAGAVAGSFVPIIGTAIGAALGGIIGGWSQYEDGTAGDTSGSGLLTDFGSGTPAVLHNKEAVLNEQQLTNLATGAQAMGAKQSQDALAPLLVQLNMTTGVLVKAAHEMVDQQKKLNNKLAWTGNLFE